jgi:four helix bundle protein
LRSDGLGVEEFGESKSDFTDLEVWKASHQLMLDIYQFCKFLPDSEKYNRKSQIQRSSCSTPACIAEGYGRYYYLENVQFCRKAKGSLYETKNHLIAIRDLDQTPKDECNNLLKDCDKVRRLLNGYIRYLLKTKSGSLLLIS